MNGSQYIVDPSGERDPRGCAYGCMIMFIAALVTITLCLLFPSCKVVQPVPSSVNRDSVRIEYRHDSIFIWQHDSIFRDRWRTGDTVYVTVEKWQTRWKDKIVQVHDTITNTQSETVVQEVKYVPNYYKNTSTGFWILLAILLVIVAWKVAKIYFKIQSGGLTSFLK